MVVNMDNFGYILLPPQIRKTLDWDSDTRLIIAIDDAGHKTVIIREDEPLCVICQRGLKKPAKNGRDAVCLRCFEKDKEQAR